MINYYSVIFDAAQLLNLTIDFSDLLMCQKSPTELERWNIPFDKQIEINGSIFHRAALERWTTELKRWTTQLKRWTTELERWTTWIERRPTELEKCPTKMEWQTIKSKRGTSEL